MQLDLFGIETKIKVDKISWSPSKREMLRQCPRKYYYQYYGASQRNAPKQPFKEQLSFLKGIGTKHLLQGDVVHTVIANYFNKIKNNNEEWDLERCKGWANLLIQESISYSYNLKNNIADERQYKPTILKEIFSDGNCDIQELMKECKEKVQRNLDNFFNSEKFQNLKNGGKKETSIIEGKAKFEIEDFVKVDGVIDIMFSESDQLIIADWKTGKNPEEDTSLQLLTYALWAIEKEGTAIKNIKIQKAYLHEDALIDLDFSENNLLRARFRIVQDAELMKEMEGFAKKGTFEAFEKCNQPNVCKHCQFQEVCIKN
jgi:hypothetical protein